MDKDEKARLTLFLKAPPAVKTDTHGIVGSLGTVNLQNVFATRPLRADRQPEWLLLSIQATPQDSLLKKQCT